MLIIKKKKKKKNLEEKRGEDIHACEREENELGREDKQMRDVGVFCRRKREKKRRKREEEEKACPL
jgi:hypothetical protein